MNNLVWRSRLSGRRSSVW